MPVGKLTRPESAPGEPSVAQKIAAAFATEMIDPGDTAGDTTAVPLEAAEADALGHLRERGGLFFGSPTARKHEAYALLKSRQAEAGAAPAAATSASAATPEGSPEEEGPGLSTLAQRLADDPATEAKFREAINELDASALEAEAVANLYSFEDEVDSWQWEDEEPAEGEGEAQ